MRHPEDANCVRFFFCLYKRRKFARRIWRGRKERMNLLKIRGGKWQWNYLKFVTVVLRLLCRANDMKTMTYTVCTELFIHNSSLSLSLSLATFSNVHTIILFFILYSITIFFFSSPSDFNVPLLLGSHLEWYFQLLHFFFFLSLHTWDS